jgi:hypothetical protein
MLHEGLKKKRQIGEAINQSQAVVKVREEEQVTLPECKVCFLNVKR